MIPESVDDEIALQRLAEVRQTLNAMPKSTESYGLIHADLHFWNFAVSPGGLTVFDFDNSEYNWFMADLGPRYSRLLRAAIRSYLGKSLSSCS